jgi:hypothetical protein
VKVYAVYKGDEFLCVGTSEECAEYLGILPRTVRYYSYEKYKRQVNQRKDPKNYIWVIKLDNEDESL